MSSERLAKGFGDIISAIDLIQSWTRRTGGIEAAVLGDPLVRSAVERQLLIISEAAVRLHKLDPGAAPMLAPEADWPGIRGIGNFLRHSYDDLDTRIILDVLQKRLDPLKDACKRAREILGSGGTAGSPPS